MESEWNCRYWHMDTWDDCIHHLFQTKDFHDITFIVETEDEKVSLPAHKLVLSMSSPVFAEMFSTPGSQAANCIVLPNLQPRMVEIMLNYIYYKTEVQFESLCQCFGVLLLATNYELSALRRICTGYIERFIEEVHVCTVYETAVSVQNRNLALKCFQFIQKRTKDIIKQDSWKMALPVTVEAIVKQEYLNIDNEEQLFEAIINWAKSRTGFTGAPGDGERMRQVIEPFLPHIRFSIMNAENFLKIAATTKVFNKEEIADIALNFVNSDSSELPQWFNRNTNHRSYDYRTTVDDTFRNDWFNTNQEVYLHSEQVEKVCSVFKAGSCDFTIDQLHIAICDDCFALNSRLKNRNIIIKVTIELDTTVKQTTIVLHITRNVKEKPAPDFDKCAPVIIVRAIPSALIPAKCVGMETHAPIVQAFLDPSCPKMICTSEHTQEEERAPSSMTAASTLGDSLNFPLDEPLLVQSAQRFIISVETANKERFFCCKKKPSFEGAPFTIHPAPDRKAEDSPGVWCALEKIRYSLSKEECTLCD